MKVKFIPIVIFLVIAQFSFGQDLSSLINMCRNNIDTIVYDENMYEFQISNNTLTYVFSKSDVIDFNAFNDCKFVKNQSDLPNRFNASKNNVWILFGIYNPYHDQRQICFSGYIQGNRYFIASESMGTWISVNNDEIKLPMTNTTINGFNRSFMQLSPNSMTYILWEQNKNIYDRSILTPLISNGDNYVTLYHSEKNSLVNFYLIASTFFFTIFIIACLYYLLFKRLEFLYYCVYLLSICFVNFRNYEWLNLNSDLFLGKIDWFDSKVFHTSAIFLSYSFFVYYFLKLEDSIAKPLLRIITWLIIIGCFLEIVLLIGYKDYSYLLYYILRNTISIIGLVFIVIIWKSIQPYSKFILLGTLILIICDLSSNFLHGIMSSMVPTIGTILEVIIFTGVLGKWAFNLYREQLKEVNESKLALLQKNETISLMRREFAQDVHDEIGSTITKIMLAVYYEKRKVENISGHFLDTLLEKINLLSKQVKNLIWLYDDSSSNLSQIQAQIREICNELDENIPINFHFQMQESTVDAEISLHIKRHILAIVNEAITNLLKHSNAKNAYITCQQLNDILLIEIRDDGCGFVDSANNSSGMGLSNMKRRAEKIGAEFEYISSESGTRISINLPLNFFRV